MPAQINLAPAENELERRFTDAFDRLVRTGKLREAIQQAIPVLTYHARETVYRAGADLDRVYNRQYVTLANGDLFSVSVTVELLEVS